MNRRRVLGALTLTALLSAVGVALLVHPGRRVVTASGLHPVAIGMPRRHILAFVGASYTASLGASSPTRGYAHEVAAALGWPAHIYAVSGSGFINAGPHGDATFAQQITRMPADLRPGLMIIQGGRNDAGFPAQRLRTAACSTVRAARQKYPGLVVVLLGNVPFRQPVGPGQRSAEHAMAVASHDCQVPFIDPIAEGWITKANAPAYVGHVPAHPNNAGYRYIADRVVADLERLSQHRIGAVHPA